MFLYSQSFRVSALSLLFSCWGLGTSPEALASMKRVAKDHSRCCHLSTPGRASAAVASVDERERKTRGNDWVTPEPQKAPVNRGHTWLCLVDGAMGRWMVLPGRCHLGTQTRAIPSDLRRSEHQAARLLKVPPTTVSALRDQKLGQNVPTAHCLMKCLWHQKGAWDTVPISPGQVTLTAVVCRPLGAKCCTARAVCA